jgi:ABC-type amino acid transport substrate-binding protein
MRRIAGLRFFVCLLVVASAHAEKVAISIGSQPPLLAKDGGIVDLVIAESLRREGYEVEYEWLPIGRMLRMLENDSLEVYVTPSNTPGQQNPHVNFLAAKGVFFYLARNEPAVPMRRLEDLAGKKVGTVINSPLRAMFEAAGIVVDEGPFDTMFLKLETGRVDFVSTADVGGLLTIRRLFPGRESEFTFTDFAYMTIGTGLYARPGDRGARILESARRGFAAIKADGTLDRMLVSFFGPTYAKRVMVY